MVFDAFGIASGYRLGDSQRKEKTDHRFMTLLRCGSENLAFLDQEDCAIRL